MKLSKTYYVYIITNNQRTLYIGVTNDLQRRMYENKNGIIEGFSRKYNLKHLVYYEETNDVKSAIQKLKKWDRKWKMELIEKLNPYWVDLSENWF